MRFLHACLMGVLLAACVSGQERTEAAKKQKSAAEAKLTAAKIKTAVAETDDLLLFATLPEEKTKALSAAMQKTFAVAAKPLKIDPASPPWPGKLSVFVFTELRQYKAFLLDALKRAPLQRETRALELRGDTPTAIDGVGLGEKPTDAQMTAEVSGLVAAALMSRKAGVGVGTIPYSLPEWLQTGFGQACYARADATGNRLSAHKSKVKSLFNKTRGQGFRAAAVWGDTASPEGELLAVSFVEYLAFGPDADKFPTFLEAFKPGETGEAPSVGMVLTAMEWKPDALEAGWRKWVATGK